jgi:thioredoxin-related protein
MIKYLATCLALLAFVFASTGHSAERKMLTELAPAIEAAARSDKLIFIKYGREACGNCQSLKTLINDRKVKLFDSEFVLVDLDCDQPAIARVFNKKYRAMIGDARTLPFVIIAKADGTPVAGIGGYKDAAAYNKFIMDAKKQAKAPAK